MKRKDLEDVNDDFSDFSLSSPARKIQRLQSHRNRDLLAPSGARLQKILSFEDVMPKVVAWSLLEPRDVAVEYLYNSRNCMQFLRSMPEHPA